MPAHVLGIDVGTGGTRAVIVDESRPHPRLRHRGARRLSPRHRLAGRSRIPKTGGAPAAIAVRKALAAAALQADQIACVGFSGQMHGAVMLDDADQVRPPGAHLVRRAHRKAVPRTYREIGARETYPAHLQSRAAQFHSDQIPVGARKRTAELEAGPLRHAAQGLRPLPAYRRAGHGHGRRFRHAAAGCREPPLVTGSHAGGGHRTSRCCRALFESAGCLRKDFRGRGRRHRLASRVRRSSPAPAIRPPARSAWASLLPAP